MVPDPLAADVARPVRSPGAARVLTRCTLAALLGVVAVGVAVAESREASDLESLVEHGYAENDGVRIHYVRMGEGPLVVLLHGFPDYWYTWRHLMPVLAEDHTVVALDLRGYNRSDKPRGVANYTMRALIGDVVAVVRAQGVERAIVIGHDWGAAIAWNVAMYAPGMTERLVILNVPHPAGLRRELATNADQQRDSQYARDFQQEGAHESLTAEGLASWVDDAAARKRYVAAFERSDFEAMLNYYKAMYPRGDGTASAAPSEWPPVRCPVLVIHGRDDKALHASGHSDTWEQVEAEMTLVMIPGAGHFVQHDATARVNGAIASWLAR